MNLATWNFQGIRTELLEVVKEIKKMNIDIIALTETKKKSVGTEKLMTIYWFTGVYPKKKEHEEEWHL